ncbi:MAG: hypothetical protein KGI59_00415 [Patescibacteria group bacterium]|nr:hypothetical protein [Patescibacteria group bacterium]MDE2172333.1 hypothetical protein [Patescibacteria group bacterium]
MASGVEFDEDGSLSRPRPTGAAGQPSSAASAGSTGGASGMSGGYSSAYARYDEQRQAAGGSRMERWLIRHHMAASPRGAQIILIGIIIVNLIITGAVIYYILK